MEKALSMIVRVQKCSCFFSYSCDPNNTVLLSEALSIAKKVNSLYHETSAKSGDQVDKAFECAVQLGHMARKQHVKQTWWRSNPHECVDSLFIPSASKYSFSHLLFYESSGRMGSICYMTINVAFHF